MANVPVLTTTADLAASQIAGAASALLPSGVVLPFAGSSAPSGWLLCNGSEISQTTYANLFAALSTTYNTQINPTTGSAWAAPSAGNFRVPDYRGIFLRGVGTASGKDAVTLGGHQTEKTKTPANAFTTAAQTVTGSVGGSDGSHQHGVGLRSDGSIQSFNMQLATTGNTYAFHSAGTIGRTTSGGADGLSATPSSGHGHSHSLTSPASTVNGGGDDETRPLNKGVNYIIKI